MKKFHQNRTILTGWISTCLQIALNDLSLVLPITTSNIANVQVWCSPDAELSLMLKFLVHRLGLSASVMLVSRQFLVHCLQHQLTSQTFITTVQCTPGEWICKLKYLAKTQAVQWEDHSVGGGKPLCLTLQANNFKSFTHYIFVQSSF